MKRNNKGFTLAEMLIVIAIIGVLVAIVTATISNAKEKAREAVDLANIRSAFSEITPYAITLDDSDLPSYIRKADTFYYTYVKVTQTKSGWQSKNLELIGDKAVVGTATVNAKFDKNTDKAYKVTVRFNPAPGKEQYEVNLMTIASMTDAKAVYYKTNEKVKK